MKEPKKNLRAARQCASRGRTLTGSHKFSERSASGMYREGHPYYCFLDSAEKLRTWRFSGDFGKHFKALCELQMWCVGCDIRRQTGNLLMKYGFTRRRSNEKSYGTSHYSMISPCGFALHLCGFAIIAADPSINEIDASLLLKRFDGSPKLLPNPKMLSQLCTPHDLRQAYVPSNDAEHRGALALFQKLAQELARYESFVEQETESTYRTDCIAAAPRSCRKIHSESLGDLWSALCTA